MVESPTYPVYRLGLVSYQEAIILQLKYRESIIKNDSLSALFLLEHNPVYTLGASFQEHNLLYDPEIYSGRGIDIVNTDRGGDITYHCPGQLVIYPIFNLNHFGKDLHLYLRNLEKATILACQAVNVEAHMTKVHTGIWSGDEIIRSIGIKVSKWITTHGVALNCNNDLTPFSWINPCGLTDYRITNLSLRSGREITVQDMMPHVINGFDQVFSIRLKEQPWPPS